MTRFPYRFARGDGPMLDGLPVVYSPHLATTDGTSFLVYRHGTGGAALTNDPDFAWNMYRAECQLQARRIVRDGLRKALPWLRGEVS